MIDKLADIESRYAEIDQLLADPEQSTDYRRIEALGKEQASIRGLVEMSREYRQLLSELESVRAMVRQETDPELVELVREELDQLLGRKEQIENDLLVAMVPKVTYYVTPVAFVYCNVASFKDSHLGFVTSGCAYLDEFD